MSRQKAFNFALNYISKNKYIWLLDDDGLKGLSLKSVDTLLTDVPTNETYKQNYKIILCKNITLREILDKCIEDNLKVITFECRGKKEILKS